MKKTAAFGLGLLFITASIWAYDPPPLGQELFLLGHPKFISSAASSAGGPIFQEGSYSAVMNPALTAGLQCLSADLGWTGLLQTGGFDKGHGGVFHLGISIPTRMGVFSGGLEGVFSKIGEVPLGNAGLARIAFARDVTENFYLGLSLQGGVISGYESSFDFQIASDLGAWYRIPELLGFIKNLRFALVLQNLGKVFDKDSGFPGFPAFITPRVGVAAQLLNFDAFVLGVSVDAAFPTIMNFLINAGVQLSIANVIYISSAWDYNVREASKFEGTDGLHLPSISIGAKFSVNTSGSEAMKKRGFNETTFDIDGAWQKLHGDVHLYSVGVAASFGVKDLLPPEISIGEIRYQE